MTSDGADQLEFWDDTVLPRPPEPPRPPAVPSVEERLAEVRRLERETGEALVRLRLEAEHDRRALIERAVAEAEEAAADASRQRVERILSDARADAFRFREEAEEILVATREDASRRRAALEAEREAVLAEARALAEEWLLEADDEWHAIVDRAIEAGRVAAAESVDALRERIVAAAELEAGRIVEAGRRGRAAELAAAEDDRRRVLDAARREHDEIVAAGRALVVRMQEDADARIAAEREVILAAAEHEAERIVAEARQNVDRIVANADAEREAMIAAAEADAARLRSEAAETLAGALRDADARAADVLARAEQEAEALRDRVAGELAPAREHLRAARADLADLLDRSRRLLPALDLAEETLPASAVTFHVVEAPPRMLPVDRPPLIGSARRERHVDEPEPPADDVLDLTTGAAEPPRRRFLARLLGR